MEVLEFIKKHLLLIFAVVAILILTISVTYIVLSVKQVVIEPKSAPVAFADSYASLPKGNLNFVLLGQGGLGHQAGDLMDSIILVSVDTENKKALEVSIPRDLWIEGRKINEGYVAGGFDLIKHQVQVVTGILPEYYVAVDFDSFVRIINELGGVDPNLTKGYEDKLYPIRGKEIDTCGKSSEEFAELHRRYSGYQLEIQFECRYEVIKFNPGVNHMDGDIALKYVRSRHGDGDFGRSERQFIILKAIADKVISKGIITKFPPLFDELTGLVRTNLKVSEIKSVAEFFIKPEDYQVSSFHLTDENVLKQGKSSSGAFILLPREGENKWQGVHRFIGL